MTAPPMPAPRCPALSHGGSGARCELPVDHSESHQVARGPGVLAWECCLKCDQRQCACHERTPAPREAPCRVDEAILRACTLYYEQRDAAIAERDEARRALDDMRRIAQRRLLSRAALDSARKDAGELAELGQALVDSAWDEGRFLVVDRGPLEALEALLAKRAAT